MDRNQAQPNIFTAPLRKGQQSLLNIVQFNGLPEEKIEQTLKMEQANLQESFQKFLQLQFTKFDIKLNRCKLQCANNSSSHLEMKNCYVSCEAGLKRFDQFINGKISHMQMLLGQCVSNAQNLPNSLFETYHCYDLYNKGFGYLKKLINEESLFYE